MSNIINIGGTSGGSGSSVVANPQGAATDTLNKLQVDGTIYGVSGGGSSGYTEAILWSGTETPSTSGTLIQLTDNISNYDVIVIQAYNSNFAGSGSFLVSALTIGGVYISTIYSPDEFGTYWTYTSDTSITIKRLSSSKAFTYSKVVGIKY